MYARQSTKESDCLLFVKFSWISWSSKSSLFECFLRLVSRIPVSSLLGFWLIGPWLWIWLCAHNFQCNYNVNGEVNRYFFHLKISGIYNVNILYSVSKCEMKDIEYGYVCKRSRMVSRQLGKERKLMKMKINLPQRTQNTKCIMSCIS